MIPQVVVRAGGTFRWFGDETYCQLFTKPRHVIEREGAWSALEGGTKQGTKAGAQRNA